MKECLFLKEFGAFLSFIRAHLPHVIVHQTNAHSREKADVDGTLLGLGTKKNWSDVARKEVLGYILSDDLA